MGSNVGDRCSSSTLTALSVIDRLIGNRWYLWRLYFPLDAMTKIYDLMCIFVRVAFASKSVTNTQLRISFSSKSNPFYLLFVSMKGNSITPLIAWKRKRSPLSFFLFLSLIRSLSLSHSLSFSLSFFLYLSLTLTLTRVIIRYFPVSTKEVKTANIIFSNSQLQFSCFFELAHECSERISHNNAWWDMNH